MPRSTPCCDRGAVFCYAGTGADRAQQTLDVTLAELRRLAQGIEEHELDRLKARIKSALVMQQEIEFRAERVAGPRLVSPGPCPHAGRSERPDRRADAAGPSTPTWPSIRRRISRWSRSAADPWRCPVEFLERTLAQRPGNRCRVQRRGLFHRAWGSSSRRAPATKPTPWPA